MSPFEDVALDATAAHRTRHPAASRHGQARARRAGRPLIGSFQLIGNEIPAPVGPLFAEICQEQELGIDMVAFTGHKALLGLTGTGGLYVREGVTPRPFMRGGTGSRSDLEHQPEFLPDAYESGTLNVAGFAGLAAGVRHLLDVGVEHVAAHERSLVDRFRTGVAALDNVVVHGPEDIEQRCGVLSFNIDGLIPSEVGTLLDQQYGIMCRVGLHCAPGAHQILGTFPTGSVRFGFSLENTPEEIDDGIAAVSEIAAWASSNAMDPAAPDA